MCKTCAAKYLRNYMQLQLLANLELWKSLQYFCLLDMFFLFQHGGECLVLHGSGALPNDLGLT